ncbi:MAG: glycoside hydrolase family 3 N-terminal domain-containing protein [Rikenellaceae bacterium]
MNRMNFKSAVLAAFAVCAAMTTTASEILPYQNTTLSAEERAADLVSRMTLKEKCSQMATDAVAIPRLNVPAYRWWNEALHGVARSGKSTIFPQSIGMAATFDTDLIYRMTDAISDEARMLYLMAKQRGNDGKYTGLTFFSPNVNIYRDPRWGRGQETFGEDPFLTGSLGVAFVKGLQGDDGRYLKTGACAKHFAVHSGPEAKRHGYDAKVEWKDMYETYLPAFKDLVQKADVESVMGAYNRTNGEVCSGSPTMLRGILREEWGFTGWIVSDCGALGNFVNDHKVCKTTQEAAALAANNTLNLNCGWVYKSALAKAVEMDLVKEATVDSLVERLMVSRFKLGLFDDDKANPYNHVPFNLVDSRKHQDLAYETAVKSMVLLENKNNTLPISPKANYIYVTGTFANSSDALIGNYYGASDKMTTFYEGITGSMPQGMSIQYRPGVAPTQYGYNDWTVREAPEGDVVIACVGLTNMLEGEITDAILSQEKGDMVDLQLPEAQLRYLKNLRINIDAKNKKKGTDTRLVVVIASGTPLIMTEIKEWADALIYAWYPGQAGGEALGDLIFGKVSFSARTPMTFVKSLDQLPDYNTYDMAGRTYKYMKDMPLYPFGYGLSYTTFNYSDLVLPKTIKGGDSAEVTVTVTNTGKMTAEEVVQLYVSGGESWGADDPLRRLAAFTKVTLRPNESKSVTLTIDANSMSVLTDQKQRVVNAGAYKVSVGGGQPLPTTPSFVEGTYTIKGKKIIEL